MRFIEIELYEAGYYAIFDTKLERVAPFGFHESCADEVKELNECPGYADKWQWTPADTWELPPGIRFKLDVQRAVEARATQEKETCR